MTMKQVISRNRSIYLIITIILVSAGLASFLDHDDSEPQLKQVQISDPDIPSLSNFFVDDSGYDTAYGYSSPIRDRSNLALTYASADDRYRNGKRQIQMQLNQLNPTDSTVDQKNRAMLQLLLGLMEMYVGHFQEADQWFARAIDDNPNIPIEFRTNLTGLRGVASLRKGELDNCVACVGPSSCIFPISKDAIHQLPDGSEHALKFFEEYLAGRPEDLGVKWLAHIARSTLGRPDQSVMEIGISWIPADFETGKFQNILQESGLGTRGPNMLGGSIWDDFNGDRLPDLFISSGDWNFGASLFLQRVAFHYEDIGKLSDLDSQRMSVNVTAADYNNDGHLDVLMLRGGWESPYRMTLLKNEGNGIFHDVTLESGLGDPIATQSAAWADFDLDGDLDLYVAGEFHDRNATEANCNRLYENLGDGRFQNIASQAGVKNQAWAKGVVWGDYDNDGLPDIYVSNMNGFNRLYHNNGDRTFSDLAATLNVIEPVKSFSCWWWDFDDDGLLDLFVTGFSASMNTIVENMMTGKMDNYAEKPRLYKNLGKEGFQDVTDEADLSIITMPMGSNYADYDNDGRLDFYLATGRPPYSMLMPNLMFRNSDGLHFQNTTVATGTGHLQKGHGVSFADHDLDGDLDLFVQTGGQTPADQSHNVLFQNPGSGQNSLQIRFIGKKSNLSAIGTKVIVNFTEKDGTQRKIYRQVTNGSSFGGNSLTMHLGLSDSDQVDRLEVQWPCSQPQIFQNIKAGQLIEIIELSADYQFIKNYRNLNSQQ
ncbi:MAG: hypothetical protein RJA81_2258 [Planctomycetota bacterium]